MHSIPDNGRTVHAGTVQNYRELFNQIRTILHIKYIRCVCQPVDTKGGTFNLN